MVPPESALSRIPILEEAQRIKPILLARQQQIIDHTEQLVAQLEPGLRAELGYPEPEVIDTSALVDVRNTKTPVISPRILKAAIPLTQSSFNATQRGRQTLSEIYSKRDDRLVVALGECAVYIPELTLENTALIQKFQKMFPNLFLLQRTFFEKPRTPPKKNEESPWKGFFIDPLYDGSDDINLGAIATRILVVRITGMGQATIKEQLNAVTPQYTDDAITQDNLGARNVLDQKAMEFGAVTSAHLANKNGLDGSIESAVRASTSSQKPHTFLGIDTIGFPSSVSGFGNPLAHILLRGGSNGPNYSRKHIAEAKQLMTEAGIELILGIDASHGNSGKNAANQPVVVEDVASQIAEGEEVIRSVHLETNVVAGQQKKRLDQSFEELQPKVSVTDDCAGPEATEGMLSNLDEATAKRREKHAVKRKLARRN